MIDPDQRCFICGGTISDDTDPTPVVLVDPDGFIHSSHVPAIEVLERNLGEEIVRSNRLRDELRVFRLQCR